ncbi:unnamed protein product [Orchesella dallaii]|uniref:Uncharacterized protein n=1 Tax=Orchesella dallaii TaxID=48710 RepID=A0ABP1PTP1_9HEXA
MQKEKITKLKTEVSELNKVVAELKNQNEKLQNMVNLKNLIISGVAEQRHENHEKDQAQILSIFKDKLGYEPAIDKVDRLGPRKEDQMKPRLLRVMFQLVRDRDFVWRNKKQLGHPYYASADLTPDQRAKISKLRKHAKLAKAQDKDVEIVWKTNQLKINGALYNVE